MTPERRDTMPALQHHVYVVYVCLIELWFYVSLDAKQVILETHPMPTSWLGMKQEGQDPLTGQRAANFRLLANQ